MENQAISASPSKGPKPKKPRSDIAPTASKNINSGHQLRYFIRDWRSPMDTACEIYVDKRGPEILSPFDDLREQTQDSEKNSQSAKTDINDLPDEILTEIARRLHPTDRIHSASRISSRWYRAVYSKGIWTQVKVKNAVSTVEAAREFLRKVGPSLRRLCIDDGCEESDELHSGESHDGSDDCDQNNDGSSDDSEDCEKSVSKSVHRFEDVLPDELRSLDLFEAHFHPNDPQESRELDVDLLQSLDRKLPNLRTLCMRTCDCIDPGTVLGEGGLDLADITSNGLFKKVRSLRVYFRENFVSNVTKLYRCRPDMLDISFGHYVDMDSVLDESSWSNGTLERLTVGCVVEGCNSQLFKCHFENLVFLEVHSEEGIIAIRNLHHLQHLHLLSECEYGEAFLSLFEKSADLSKFPNTLRYLVVQVIDTPSVDVAELIGASCPELRSLLFDCDYFSGDEPQVMCEISFVKTLAPFLRNLRFLRVRWLGTLDRVWSHSDVDVFPDLYCVVFQNADYLEVSSSVFLCRQSHKWPKLILYNWYSREFFTYKQNDDGQDDGHVKNFLDPISEEESRHIQWMLEQEEGYCCVSQKL